LRLVPRESEIMDLNQITVPAVDVAASVAFYKLLGLRLIVDSVPRYARFECPDGNSTFSVEHTTETLMGAGIAVYFECEKLDETVALMKQKGLHFESDPADQSWLWREARLRDPSGNQICLFKAGVNRKNPPWRVASE
jgi:catechol 2,3-dioxygenase-like lactoylglutathione lyase family enzyme